MNTSSNTRPGVAGHFPNRRLAREWKTVTAMIHIYCRDQHGCCLCPDCWDLMQYVSLRLCHCRFGEEKPTCAKCPVHCYQRDRREKIKSVMRYAGPRMMWEHPWLSLRHLVDGWVQNRAAARFENGRGKRAVAGGVIAPESVMSPPERSQDCM
jgi:hypothetical protein